MLSTAEITTDERLDKIQQQIAKFADNDFSERIPLTGKEDKIELIAIKLNALADKLSDEEGYENSAIKIQKYHESRANELLEMLLRYTVLDFSEKLTISDRGDEWDAIAIAINTLIEELQNHTEMLDDMNEQLQATNKELESFSYSISHDLRAPLRAIHGYARIISEAHSATASDEAKRLHGLIQKNAKQMGVLIDDLLNFSRLSRKEMNKRTIDMNEVCETVIREIEEQDDYSNTKIAVDDLPSAEGDHAMIKQVMMNIISNAYKYSAKNEQSTIEISGERKEGEVIYKVKDNGIGFDMAYSNKLFGVFQRLHNNKDYTGTGVGLAIVQRIVTKHGGKVWAESKPNQGAIFYFSLPN